MLYIFWLWIALFNGSSDVFSKSLTGHFAALKDMFLNKTHHKRVLSLLLITAAAMLFYVAFQYFWLADFPIGTDVLNHIDSVHLLRQSGFGALKQQSLYPLSIVFYSIESKILEVLFGYSLAFSFVFVVSLNLFVTAILTGILAFRLFKNYQIAILASFLMATSRFMVDNLRMGVMAESFGWIFFLLSMIYLVERKWLAMVISMVLLLFIHPMPFGVFLVFLLAALLYQAFTSSKPKYKKYHLLMLGAGALIIFLLYLWDPMGNFSRAISLAQSDGFAIQARSFYVYMTENEQRCLLVYFASFIGAFFLIWRGKQEANSRLAALFYFVGLFVAFKDWFGFHYLSYRFYFYYEFIVAIIAGYGLLEMLKLAFEKYAKIIFMPLAFLMVLPAYHNNYVLTRWELFDYMSGHIVPKKDRDLSSEVASFVEPGATVYSQSYWARWLIINNNMNVLFGTFQGFPNAYEEPRLSSLKNRGVKYIYFSSIEPVTAIEENDELDLVIDKDGVRLYEIK